MAKISSVRRLLRNRNFEEVKSINAHYSLPPRKSKEQLVEQVVRHCKRDISQLVSSDGPYSLVQWNEVAVELGGLKRKSFEVVAAEIERRLDPIFDKFDGDTTVAAIRIDKAACGTLASMLRIDDLAEQFKNASGKLSLSNFIARIRALKPAVTQHKQMTEPTVIRLASTRTTGNLVEKLNYNWMKSELAYAESLDIAAGFYDPDLINILLAESPIKNVRLLFNRLGGRRLKEQSDELQAYQELLRQLHSKVEIRLASAPGLFHSKLFLMKGANHKSALIGSANATKAAFERNEEILISLTREIDPLFDYFEAAWKNASLLGPVMLSSTTLISFFRTGVMYFKPNESLSFTINPFRELINRLSDEQKNQLGSVSLPHAELEPGIGPFSLRIAARTEVSGNLESGTAAFPDNNPEKSKRIGIKKYSIETCYGYWVPSALDDELNEALENVGEAKKVELMQLKARLEEIGELKLAMKYREYIDAAKISFSKVNALSDLLDDLTSDPFSERVFEKLYDRTISHLSDDLKIARLSRPFISGPVPEIWDDLDAYVDFKSTFFDYVRMIGNRSTRPFVPAQILNRLNFHQLEPVESDELAELFEQSLVKEPWQDKHWQRKA